MRRWLSDPVAGFAATAAGVFLLYGALGGEPEDAESIIEITRADVDRLKESFEAVWPSKEHLGLGARVR